MIIKYSPEKLAKIVKKHLFKFVILHGSFAVSTNRHRSDLDIAVLGKKPIDLKRLLKLQNDLADIFGNSKERELDIKTLDRADPLFRYEVVRDGVLLAGNPILYEDYKMSSLHLYDDAQQLFELEKILVQKYQKHLNQKYA